MPLSDVLSQIPGYAGYQAARLRNQQQDSNRYQSQMCEDNNQLYQQIH